MSGFVVEMLGIEKSFNHNKVLHSVDFYLRGGSIHALLGENGTGKTTLMNILGGVLKSDAGEIRVDSAPIIMHDTSVSENNGIAFIHQELTLINDLAVYENLFLGKELKKNGILNKSEMVKQSRDILEHMGIDLNPTDMVSELNVSYKQVVEIARALLRNARVIIMDEPTASLTDIEIDNVFSIMRSLKGKGVSFVFISHKLREIMLIADSYTVMRDGRVVADGAVDGNVSEESLARYMVGKEIKYDDVYSPRPLGDTIIEVKGLSRNREYRDINFSVSKGEIVGFTGLLGDGRSEIFATVYGCNKPERGVVLVKGKLTRIRSTSAARNNGISFVPRDRKENGIVKDLSVASNMSLSIIDRLKGILFISHKKESQSNQVYVDSLHIRVSDINVLITSLSGGNQQKVVLAKALGPKPELIILDNPTQGVDVGAKLEIYNIIIELAKQGVSFVILSSEAQEILMLCDRIYVMYHGEIRRELSRAEASEENIMILATGGSVENWGRAL
ncbi:MAG: sugar ABC transporter ATP-binding protein [Clostridiales bacterium]|nr:sugar ABC transporter ATP-binding protein [Clostridiales bacterium]